MSDHMEPNVDESDIRSAACAGIPCHAQDIRFVIHEGIHHGYHVWYVNLRHPGSRLGAGYWIIVTGPMFVVRAVDHTPTLRLHTPDAAVASMRSDPSTSAALDTAPHPWP